MGASQNGHSEVVELLLMNGAKMELQDDIRRSAGKLKWLCGVIKILLDNGAHVDV